MSQVHRSIFFSAVERYGSLFFFLLSTAILARLLTPEEFGTYAVINAVTVIVAASFQEFGGANYLIQKQNLSERNIRTAFTITLLLSIAVGIVLFFLRDITAAFFAQDGMRIGIAVSVLNFLVWPFSITIAALFRRDLAFGALAACNLAGNFATAAISIALALMQFSYMAPVWGTLAGNAIAALLLVRERKNVRIFLPSFSGYRDVVGFGLYSGGVVIINVFYNLAPQLTIARVMDFTAVGLYSRAVTLTQTFDKLVIQVLSPVIMPAIFAQTKAGGDLKRIYLDAIELLTAVHWPFLLVIAIMAHPLILVWLGPTWIDIVPLVRLLCIGYLALFAACLSYPVLVAVGSVRDALLSSLISLPPSLLLIFAASFYGVEAVAASALVTLPFQAFVAIYFISRHLAFGPADVFRAVRKSAVVALFTSTAAVIIALLIHAGVIGPLAGLICVGVCAAVSWFAGLAVTNHPLLAHVRSAINGLLSAVPPILPVRNQPAGGPTDELPHTFRRKSF
jgi:O-antigen/teichoic acid export membrane protein